VPGDLRAAIGVMQNQLLDGGAIFALRMELPIGELSKMSTPTESIGRSSPPRRSPPARQFDLTPFHGRGFV
jgi:hypothetical protein